MAENHNEITQDLIHYFKVSSGGIENFNFVDDVKKIVPTNLEHHYLLNHFEVDEIVYKHYHSPTSFLLSDEEFKEEFEYRDMSMKETSLKPYTFCFNGAFIKRNSLIHQLHQIVFSKDRFKPKINGKIIKYLEELAPYFEEFAEGFAEGFLTFENNEIKPYLIFLADKNEYVKKVAEYVLPPHNIFKLHNYASGRGFSLNGNSEVCKGFEAGVKEGYFYKAWSIILSNCNLFVPVFKDYFFSGVKTSRPDQNIESHFTVLEWATIFYYADETKLLPENRFIKTRMDEFMNKHQINTTFDNLKTKYYEAKRRINEKNDYPIYKLELIIPFLKENYKQTVTKVENDIIFLKENNDDY